RRPQAAFALCSAAMAPRWILVALALAACATPPAAPAAPSGPPAIDLALVHARLPDGATAIAIAAGRIVAVGGDEVARGAREVRDLDGAFVLPGLRDAHLHLAMWGDVLLGRVCDLAASTSEEDALARVRAFVAARGL